MDLRHPVADAPRRRWSGARVWRGFLQGVPLWFRLGWTYEYISCIQQRQSVRWAISVVRKERETGVARRDEPGSSTCHLA